MKVRGDIPSGLSSFLISYYLAPLILLQLIFFAFATDTSFYWSHRLMHTKSLWQYHKVHHSLKVPLGIGAEYAHPVTTLLNVLTFKDRCNHLQYSINNNWTNFIWFSLLCILDLVLCSRNGNSRCSLGI